MALTLRYVGPSLRDGHRDFIAVIASLGETRLRDITVGELAATRRYVVAMGASPWNWVGTSRQSPSGTT